MNGISIPDPIPWNPFSLHMACWKARKENAICQRAWRVVRRRAWQGGALCGVVTIGVSALNGLAMNQARSLGSGPLWFARRFSAVTPILVSAIIAVGAIWYAAWAYRRLSLDRIEWRAAPFTPREWFVGLLTPALMALGTVVGVFYVLMQGLSLAGYLGDPYIFLRYFWPIMVTAALTAAPFCIVNALVCVTAVSRTWFVGGVNGGVTSDGWGTVIAPVGALLALLAVGTLFNDMVAGLPPSIIGARGIDHFIMRSLIRASMDTIGSLVLLGVTSATVWRYTVRRAQKDLFRAPE